MNWRYLMLFTFLLAVVFWFAQSENAGIASESPIITKIKGVISGKLASEDKPQEQTTTITTASVQNSEIVKELETWLQTEAAKMDTNTYDSVAEESKLRQRAQAFTQDEIQMLKDVALDTGRSANERILSSYMLSLSGVAGIPALQQLATAELSHAGPQEPHSLGETQNMHEKALRRAAIDKLFEYALADASLIPQLARTIEEIPVPEIKSYAQSRFKQLFGG